MRTYKYVLMLNEQRELYLTSNGYSNICGGSLIQRPDIVVDYVRETYNADLQPVEKTWLICMDTRGKVTGSFEVSSGTINSSVLSPREVYRMALMTNTASVVLCHNHPSGDPTPSESDRDITKRLIEAGNLLDIPLNDHVVVGDNGKYFSFRESLPDLF